MSDTEETGKSSKSTKNSKLRRKSIEMNVTELVRAKVLVSKSNELKRQERYYEEYEAEIQAIDSKREEVQQELKEYRKLQTNMNEYFADELKIDMEDDDHRNLHVFLKKHVSIDQYTSNKDFLIIV